MKISEAVEFKTPKGSRLGDLTVDQIDLVAQKGTGDLQLAAEVLLTKVPSDALKAWTGLVKRAQSLGLIVDALPGDSNGITFYNKYMDLVDLIKNAQEEDNQQIPAEFGGAK